MIDIEAQYDRDAKRAEDAAKIAAVSRINAPHADIISAVCEEHGVTRRELVGQSRVKHLVRARQDAFYRLRQVTNADGRHRYSLPGIGRIMGNRDHTTVLHGIKRHAALNAHEADNG